jgi:chemotaxis family two-component system response regulator Rcp1
MGASGSNPREDKDQPSASPSLPESAAVQERRAILIVEDNRADVFLIREALEAARLTPELHIVTDGEKAVQFIDEADADAGAPCPVVIILDLNLPKKSGVEVLAHLRQSRKCAATQVLIVTSSDSAQDREETTRLGANVYFRKPSGYDAYLKLGEIVRTMLGPDEPVGQKGA